MNAQAPSSEQLDGIRGVGATAPMFLPATSHPSRSAPFVLMLSVPFVFGLAFSLYALTDEATGWPWKVGVVAFTAVFGFWIVRGFRQGVVIERGRDRLAPPAPTGHRLGRPRPGRAGDPGDQHGVQHPRRAP